MDARVVVCVDCLVDRKHKFTKRPEARRITQIDLEAEKVSGTFFCIHWPYSSPEKKIKLLHHLLHPIPCTVWGSSCSRHCQQKRYLTLIMPAAGVSTVTRSVPVSHSFVIGITHEYGRTASNPAREVCRYLTRRESRKQKYPPRGTFVFRCSGGRIRTCDQCVTRNPYFS